MARRLIETTEGSKGIARTYYDAGRTEYCCEFTATNATKISANYHTENRQDALSAALHMAHMDGGRMGVL